MNTKQQNLVNGKYSFEDLVDLDRLREMFEHFSQATGFSTGLASYPDQKLLIATGWRDICTKFHRVYPASEVYCKQSNLELTSHLRERKSLNIRHCESGLVDGATPVIIKDAHVANLFTGQVLFKEPDIEFFRKQGQAYGYDVDVYLEALEKVPVVTEERFKSVLHFLSEMTIMLAEQGMTELHSREIAQAAQESEEKYHLLADNISDNIWILDLDTLRLTYLSPSVFSHSGYNVDEVMGLHLQDVLTPSSMALATSVLKEELSAESQNADPLRSRTLELEQYHKDGSILWAEVSVRFIYDNEGKPVSVLGVSRNITERKQAEEALRESEERLDLAVKGSDLGMWDWNVKTGDLAYSEHWAEMLGYELDELEPHISTFESLIHPEDKDMVLKALKQHITDDNFEYNTEFRLKTKFDDWRWINSRGRIFTRDKEKKPLRMVGIQIDITERKKIESHFQQTQKLEAIGTLAGGIAHDFNNILSAIVGYTELSLSDLEPGTLIHGNLSKILKASERASDLVQQILRFGRQSDQELLSIRIKLIVKEAVKFIRATLPASIEIRQNLKSNPIVIADPTQIHQIVMNLCTNAGHAMQDKGGTLTIGLENSELDVEFTEKHQGLQPGNYVKLTISDTGDGILPENLDRIFDPYFTTKEKGKGTGLGLAAVHGIVRSHGGTITVESQVGEGTKFDVYLPSAADSNEKKEGPDSQLIGGKERILLVDDEEDIIAVEKEMLEKLGYTVIVSDKADEALKIFAEQPDQFDLVISDMTMPKLTGDKLAGKLIQIRSDIPVILCTGFSERLVEEGFEYFGIKAFLMKPVSLKDLSSMVRKVLDKK